METLFSARSKVEAGYINTGKLPRIMMLLDNETPCNTISTPSNAAKLERISRIASLSLNNNQEAKNVQMTLIRQIVLKPSEAGIHDDGGTVRQRHIQVDRKHNAITRHVSSIRIGDHHLPNHGA